LKVCIVTTMFPKYKDDYYGSFVYDDAKELVKKGIEVHVVTQHNAGIPYDELMEGIHVHRFRWLEPKKFRALIHFKGIKDNFRLMSYVISNFFTLISVVKKYKINIIHAHHAIPSGFISVLVSKIFGIPIFITTHGMDITTHDIDEGPLKNVKNFEEHSIFKRLISYSLNNSDKIIAVSGDLADRIRSFGVKEENITILRNAVDITRFKPIENFKLRKKFGFDKEDILILFVGHLEVFKGLFELIYAFKNVKEENKFIKLIIIGDGSQKEEAKRIVNNFGLEGSVYFIGKVPPKKIHNYYQLSDIFVLPSYTDAGGPPVVFIEAMACGLPVIGTNVGGIPEGITEGENGFIVCPKDFSDLAKKLQILVNNKNLRRKFGNVSVQIITKKSWNIENKMSKLIRVYKNFLSD